MLKWLQKENFRIFEEIATTSFSRVVGIENVTTKKRFVGKYVDFGDEKAINRLKSEVSILNIINGSTGFPQFNGYYQSTNLSIIMMPLYGKSLSYFFKQHKKFFSLKTVLLIAIQLLERLEYLYLKGIVHHDLKPENILVGLGPHSNQLILIDFGLAYFFKDFQKNEFFPLSYQNKFTGTVRYASINTHEGFSPTPRDDLQSLAYMLIYFLKGSLPWQHGASQNVDGVGAIKRSCRPQDLCGDLPQEFSIFLKEILELGFDSKPQYGRYKMMFQELYLKGNFCFDYGFDWRFRKAVSFSFSNEEKPEMLQKSRTVAPRIFSKMINDSTLKKLRICNNHQTRKSNH